MTTRSAFKQSLRQVVSKKVLTKANNSQSQEIIAQWREVLTLKQEVDECGWDEITALLFNMKIAMKEAAIPQVDIDIVVNLIREFKDIRSRIQNLYITEGTRVDQLESLWGLEAGALE